MEQRYYQQHNIRTSSKPQAVTPYTRRSGDSSFKFVGKNVEVRKEKIHDPNSTPRNNDATYVHSAHPGFMKMDRFASERLDPLGIQSDVDLGNRRQIYDSVINLFSKAFEKSYEQELQRCQQRFPVQMIGNLSLTEADILGPKHPLESSERDPQTKTPAVKEMTEKKYNSCSSNAKAVSTSDTFQVRRRENVPRLLSGTVEKVMYWFKLKSQSHLLFEVTAFLVEKRSGKLLSEKHLILKDEKIGPSLEVIFYEIDRPLPVLNVGDVVKCVGRPKSRNCLQAFKVEQSSPQEKHEMQRLFFISNLAAEEALTSQAKKSE